MRAGSRLARNADGMCAPSPRRPTGAKMKIALLQIAPTPPRCVCTGSQIVSAFRGAAHPPHTHTLAAEMLGRYEGTPQGKRGPSIPTDPPAGGQPQIASCRSGVSMHSPSGSGHTRGAERWASQIPAHLAKFWASPPNLWAWQNQWDALGHINSPSG